METRTVNTLVIDRCKQGSETVPCPRKRLESCSFSLNQVIVAYV